LEKVDLIFFFDRRYRANAVENENSQGWPGGSKKCLHCKRKKFYMSSLPKPSFSAKLNWDKFVPDLIILFLYFFCLDPLMEWQLQHLALSCTILMLLNIVALGLGCFTFFTAYADMDGLIKYRDSLSIFESAALGLSAFISCLAFFWWLVPFAAVKKMGVTDTGFLSGATGYFITFLVVMVGSINYKKGITITQSTAIKAANSAVTIFFFFFSYAFLLMALQHWNPTFIAAPYLAILCMFVFYLPLRFFLLFRPPFNKLEYISFILSFGFLMIGLFVRL
jgi:hypothetical protein